MLLCLMSHCYRVTELGLKSMQSEMEAFIYSLLCSRKLQCASKHPAVWLKHYFLIKEPS